jgi:hypothetical protein
MLIQEQPMEDMNAATSADFENWYPDYDAAAAYYGYGEADDTTSSQHGDEGGARATAGVAVVGSTASTTEMSDYFPTEVVDDDSFYPIMGMTSSSSTSSLLVPGSPLPAERLARKQRLFVRRGGHCHASLLQSAVMACMSSPKDDDEDKPAWDYSSDHTSTTTTTMDAAAIATGTTSPRKRLRRTDRPRAVFHSEIMNDDDADNNNDNDDANNERKDEAEEEGIAGASMLLASLTMSPLCGGGTMHSANSIGSGTSSSRRDGNFSRAPPIRRVSRKKSYTSVASGASGDYEEEEFDDF